MTETFFTWSHETLTLHITTQPGASKTEIAGILGGRLKIRVKAIPENGKANQALLRFLSEILEIPVSHCTLIRGHTSRQKTISLSPIQQSAIEQLLKLIPAHKQTQLDF